MFSRLRTLKKLCLLIIPALLLSTAAERAAAQTDLRSVKNGGSISRWLLSNSFPAEIDAGAWENFNRFNVETLPAKNWLAPFGKPQAGTFKNANPVAQEKARQFDENGNPLPEIAAASITKVFPDAAEITWREITENDATLDFYALFGANQIGTAYAATYINSLRDETRYLETDGFLGKIWLNGTEIYNGFSLDVNKIARAELKKGENLLIVRASGVSGDYWRKNGGWTVMIRLWQTETEAYNSAAFKPSGATGTINYLEGFHVDPVYLHDQRGYARITLSNTAQYLRNLRSDPRYGVYLSEIDYLKPYLDTNPQDRNFLREAVKAGRVGSGGAYNQFNENTIGGEAIIRNLLYGQAMHQQLLGRKSESLALWDVFGHAPQISQIARGAGFTGLVWSKKIQGFNPFFYDYALDGSRLLHRRVDYAYSFSGFGSGKNYSLDNFRRLTERKFQETQSFNSATDLRINAADFTPPWTNLSGNVATLEAQRPQIRVSGQAQDFYFRELSKEIAEGKVKPPLSSRDKLFFHVGVNMARSDLKIGQRVSENMTLTAEKFGSIAYLLGAKYADLALDKAWRQIFFGSHHDAITGTPSDNALLDLVYGYREAYELSENALNDSLSFVAKQVNTICTAPSAFCRGVPIVVFNPLNWTRTDAVRAKIKFDFAAFDLQIRDQSGAIIQSRILGASEGETELEFVARDVPSIGYKTFYAEPLKKKRVSADRNDSEFLENEFYRIKISAEKGGAIESIFDKQANREVVDVSKNHFANEIGVLQEDLTKKNVIYPAWELWTTGKKSFSSETKAAFAFERNGDAQILKVKGVLPNKTAYVQTITLRKGIRRIDFKTELIDYKGQDELFVINFPLALTGGALVTEDRFGTVVRNSSRGFLDFRTNTDKLVSGAPVYAVNNWAEYGSVFNLNFVDEKNQIAASVPFKPAALIRPHGASFENLTETLVSNLIKRGVTITPFYDDNDLARRKKLEIEDSTMPKNLNDDAAYHNFRITLGTGQENSYSAKLLKQIAAATKADFEKRLRREGFSFLFLYDAEMPKDYAKMPVLLIAADSAENYQKAIAQIVKPIAENKFEVGIPLESFAAETNTTKDLPKVPDYGVALINNGTAGVSLEDGNVLTMFLTHTAIFPGVNLPFKFTPEHKTHVFDYSLYPHAKDWREADTVKVGYDANNPLVAVQTDIHKGNLPNEYSFLNIPSDKSENIVLTALKLGENPQASFQTGQQENRRSVILRFNETEGRVNPFEFKFSTRPKARGDSDFYNAFWRLTPVDLLENKIQNAAFEKSSNSAAAQFSRPAFGSFEIKSYKLELDGQIDKKETRNSPVIGATAELVQPVFSRYWNHNQGAAPIGNDAVKVSLRPLEQEGELSSFAYDDKYNQGGTTTIAVRVQVINNYQDRRVSGAVQLEIPDDWRAVPASLNYDIEPNGSFIQDVSIITFPVKKDLEFKRASGLIKARLTHDGQTFQDVLNIGQPFKLEWTTEQTVSETIIKIKNPHRQSIEGAVALITPPETWFVAKARFPREIGFAVAPEAETILKFNHGIFPPGTWRIARLVYNGNVEYSEVK